MNNFKRIRNGLQFNPTDAPLTGKVGETYYNKATNKLMICVQETPTVKWELLNLGAGTTDSSPLTWNDSTKLWSENSNIIISQTTIRSTGQATKDVFIEAADASVVDTDGGNIAITAGAGNGTGKKGKLSLSGNIILLDIPLSTDPLTGAQGEVYYNTVIKSFKYHDGITWRPLGSGAGFVKVDVHDPVETSLPSVANPIIDGYTLQEGDLVLFTGLTVDNNRIYKVTDVATAPVWTPELAFNGSAIPTVSDTVIVKNGTWLNQVGAFDGTAWKFNEKIRQFNGVDYFEQSTVYATTILDDTNGELFRVGATGSEYMVIDYSVKRGSAREVGQLYLVHDGATATVVGSNGSLVDTGVLFSAGLDTTDIVLYYVADLRGTDGVFKFSVKRWSDAMGGPAGLPSYSGWTPSAGAAAGSAGDIQFSDGTYLTASSLFKINTSDNAMEIGGMQIHPLSAPVGLNDDQPTPSTIFTYPAIWEFVEVKYSMERGTNRRRGRLFVTNNGAVANITDDYVEIDPFNVIFNVTLVSGNINIQYISSPNGTNPSFRYTVERWQ